MLTVRTDLGMAGKRLFLIRCQMIVKVFLSSCKRVCSFSIVDGTRKTSISSPKSNQC